MVSNLISPFLKWRVYCLVISISIGSHTRMGFRSQIVECLRSGWGMVRWKWLSRVRIGRLGMRCWWWPSRMSSSKGRRRGMTSWTLAYRFIPTSWMFLGERRRTSRGGPVLRTSRWAKVFNSSRSILADSTRNRPESAEDNRWAISTQMAIHKITAVQKAAPSACRAKNFVCGIPALNHNAKSFGLKRRGSNHHSPATT